MSDDRDREIEVSLNRTIVDKMPPASTPDDWKKYNYNWRREETTARGLAIEVFKGFGFAPVFLNNRRKKMNFQRAYHVALDFDAGDDSASFARLLEDDFIYWYSSFLYYTPSSRPPAYKSRVVFVLDGPIVFGEQYELLLSAMAWKYPKSDQATTDAARLFYGSKGAAVEPIWSTLPLEICGQLVAEYEAQLPPKVVYEGPTDRVITVGMPSANFLKAKLSRLLDNVLTAPDGEKHTILRSTATTIGGFVGAGYFDRGEAETALQGAIRQHVLKDEAAADLTIKEALSYGMSRPLYIDDAVIRIPQVIQ